MAGKKILVAPLDWGLGHATRCIPVIKALLKNNCSVWLAGEGQQVVLLSNEFPLVPILKLKGYRVNYSASGMIGKILIQVPKILTSIRYENKWLKEQVDKYEFDFIIADNRYGLYHKKVHSIFMTHQLNIKSPLGKWSEKILRLLNYKFIDRFDECWVPDEEGENNLAGDLSHPENLPAIPVKYIGFLSRFNRMNSFGENEIETSGHLLIILSGPEPQRSLLEENILQQLSSYSGTATIVRGLPEKINSLSSSNHVQIFNHLPAELLHKELVKAEYVISRSGYSTVMDITAMKKKSILIPTPDQTEQEYLASYLTKKQFAYCVSQKNFSLQESIEKAKAFPYVISF